MKYMFLNDFYIDYSRVDNSVNLSIDNIFQFGQISVTEFFKTFDYDNLNMKNKYDAAWVLIKACSHINNLPTWNQNIHSKTYLTNIGKLDVDVETSFYDDNDNLLFAIKDKMCAINLNTRRIIKLQDIGFMDFDTYPCIINNYDNKIDNDLTFDENIKVRYLDIDATNHINNVSYVKYIVNNLDKSFFDNKKIININLHYLKEALLHDNLSLYKKDENNIIYYALKKDDVIIFNAKIEYTKKEA